MEGLTGRNEAEMQKMTEFFGRIMSFELMRYLLGIADKSLQNLNPQNPTHRLMNQYVDCLNEALDQIIKTEKAFETNVQAVNYYSLSIDAVDMLHDQEPLVPVDNEVHCRYMAIWNVDTLMVEIGAGPI